MPRRCSALVVGGWPQRLVPLRGLEAIESAWSITGLFLYGESCMEMARVSHLLDVSQLFRVLQVSDVQQAVEVRCGRGP